MKVINRLRKDQDFKRVISYDLFVKNRFFVTYFHSNDLGYARIGISTSKKLGIAVIRNKIRRQVRSMVADLFDLNQPVDLIIVVRSDYKAEDYFASRQKLEDLFTALRRVTNEPKK